MFFSLSPEYPYIPSSTTLGSYPQKMEKHKTTKIKTKGNKENTNKIKMKLN